MFHHIIRAAHSSVEKNAPTYQTNAHAREVRRQRRVFRESDNMFGKFSLASGRLRSIGLARLAIGLTLIACLGALFLRGPLRARYWAWRLANAEEMQARAAYLGALCNTGDEARWAVHALLVDERPTVRAYGAMVLQHVNAPWGRDALIKALRDEDEVVQRLAALGLAVRRDDTVVPKLMQLYQVGSDSTAVAACHALGRLATPAAAAALRELAPPPAPPDRRAAIVDALAAVAGQSDEPALAAECACALIGLLADDRTCSLLLPDEVELARLGPLLAAQGHVASAPATTTAAQSVADRAAAALGRITAHALERPWSDTPAEGRAAAAQAWHAWADATRSDK
jgi:hypothetical protein